MEREQEASGRVGTRAIYGVKFGPMEEEKT